jgi:hypothetical protein
MISRTEHEDLKMGKNEIVLKDKGNWVAGTYIMEWKHDDQTIIQRVVFEP